MNLCELTDSELGLHTLSAIIYLLQLGDSIISRNLLRHVGHNLPSCCELAESTLRDMLTTATGSVSGLKKWQKWLRSVLLPISCTACETKKIQLSVS